MAHNNRVRGAADAWLNILPTELQQLGANLTSGINGDDGSFHAPASPIVIAGIGGLHVTGPTVVARGGQIVTPNDTSTLVTPTISFGDSDWTVLDPSNVYATRTPLERVVNGRGLPNYTWTVRRENASLQAFASMFDLGDGIGMRPARAYVPLRPHDRSTISQIKIYFHVGVVHTTVPVAMPAARIVRVDAVGNAVVLTSTAAGADANGYVYVPTPSTGAAWTNAFATQSFVVPCDQNNVVDRSQYDYFVELVEEQGLTGWPYQLTYANPYPIVATTGANVSLTGHGPIDNVTFGNGDLVLVKDQADPTQNGVYVAASGSWTRAAFTFVQGMVFPVAAGNINGGTFWQANPAFANWTPSNPTASPPTAGTPITFLPQANSAYPLDRTAFIAYGISWHCLQPTYSKIPDLRPA